MLTGKGDEEFVTAIGAADTGETVVEVAALEEMPDGFVVDRPPVATLAGIAISVDGAKLVPVLADEMEKVGFERLARAIDAGGFGDEAGQGGPFPVMDGSLLARKKFGIC